MERFHPWVFSGAIDRIEGPLEEGDLVVVRKSNGDVIGYGHCAIGSIAVRLFSFGERLPGAEFWEMRIRQAYRLREMMGLTNAPDTNVYRLIHGEGDGLPGLIADYYNGTVVLQAHTVGMWLVREAITSALRAVLGDKLSAVYDKSAKTLPFKANIEAKDSYLFGTSATGEVLEYGNRFKVDWLQGQKTGFFIDQRENRRLLASYARDKSVLNMFCYTGGFSFSAMQGGAKLVHSVDSSA
jgi:23S rRNA (cytosine1962-C5)-methyltransferase